MSHSRRSNRVTSLLVVLPTLGLMAALPPKGATAGAAADMKAGKCQMIGTWLEPAESTNATTDRILDALAQRKIVLLGESHDNVEHHRWQLHVLAGLLAHRPKIVVGFEMFPRAVQPALDAWSEGLQSEAEFLKASRWREVWGYDPELYLPLFHFVRQNRLPAVALNVDRKLVARVGREGWTAVPAEAREGLTDPAPASDAYRRALAEVYAAKQKHGLKGPPHGGRDGAGEKDVDAAPDIAAILESEEFARFVEAQLTWDRAMAEALFGASRDTPEALVVGVLGRGHIEYGHGVPHQLAALGEDSVAVLLPVEGGEACNTLEPDIADAVFLLAPGEAERARPAKPRLGVMIEQAETGVRVLQVVEGSVAEAAGLKAGDVIVSAATFPVDGVEGFIEIVQRQAPGTWLPLQLDRDGERRRIVAEFPASFQ